MHLIIPEKCIYCLEGHDGTREHIVPEALNGRLILPEATCETCREKINSQIESPLLSFHYKKTRRLRKFRSKKKSVKLPNENVWRFVLKRNTPPFEMTVPARGSEHEFTDIVYRYNLPGFLTHLYKDASKRAAVEVRHPMEIRDVVEQERELRRADKDITAIVRQTPIFRRDLVARLICKVSCGLFAGLFGGNSADQLRSFVREGGDNGVFNRFVRSASREHFPMTQGEARFFIRSENGEKILYTALNVFPRDIPEVYFIRVAVPDAFDIEEFSVNCLVPLPAKKRLYGSRS